LRIERATALAESLAQVLGLAGPALAGVLIAVVGPSNVLWIDAASFAVSALLLVTCVPEPARRVAQTAGGYLSDLVAGLRFVAHEPVLFPLVLFFFAMNVVIGPIDTVVLPVYASEVFDSSIAFGLMAAAGGAGGLIGTTVFGWIGHRLSRRAVFTGGFLAVPLALGALTLTPGLPLTLAILTLLGLALGLTNVLEYTIYFERIPEGMRARALGITGAIGWGSTPLGRIGGGYLLEWFGLTAGLGILAVAFLPVPLTMFAVRAFHDLNPPPDSARDA
jgi:predicted MFS family arabinose efflux permease